MSDVTLVGISDDGADLILSNESGAEFTLAINDELRAAVRHARVQAAAAVDADEQPPGMTPREIQQRIRAGLNAAELSELTGEPLETLERYEAPVLAERAYIADLARTTRIGRDAGSPVLGDLVTDRLASRGVDPEAVAWDAWRDAEEPWRVSTDFKVDGRSIHAVWTFDHTARSLTAEDDESRWLTETELLDVPIPRRHLTAVRPEADNVRGLHETRPTPPAAGEAHPPLVAIDLEADAFEQSATESLLDDLDRQRGQRDAVDAEDIEAFDEDGGFEGFGPASHTRNAEVGFSAPRPSQSAPQSGQHPAGSARQTPPQAPTAVPDVNAETGAASADAPAQDKRPVKKGRASVPSWDEIVFGAKSD